MKLSPAFNIGVWNAWIFMSVFILQMIVIFLANKSIMERSHVPNDARKTVLDRHIGILANFFWLLALGYSIFLPLQLGTVWFYIGLIVFIFGTSVLSAATYSFMTTPADQMIIKGVYKFSRHPMYWGTFLICLGAGIASASWILVLLSIIISACLNFEGRVEERYCLDRYGPLYADYLNRVPGWFGIPK